MTPAEALARAINAALGNDKPPSVVLADAILAALAAAGWVVVPVVAVQAAYRIADSQLSVGGVTVVSAMDMLEIKKAFALAAEVTTSPDL